MCHEGGWRLRVFATLTVWVGVGGALAEPYWVAYEGDVFPEEVGWEHLDGYGADPNGPGSARWLEDGCLVIDSRADQMLYDYYEMNRSLEPDPGHRLVVTWRLRIAESYGYGDTTIQLGQPGRGNVVFCYSANEVASVIEGWSWAIAPGEFHTYRFESQDMQTYDLWIDDQLVHEGAWLLPDVPYPYMLWGDGGYGGGSRTLIYWDYFRFGTVPEARSCALACVVVAVCARFRRVGGRRSEI